MNTQTFQVGEVALFCKPGSKHFGMEVTISGPLSMRLIRNTKTGAIRDVPAYVIEPIGHPELRPSGRSVGFATEPFNLRKRPAPGDREKIGSWQECPWTPKLETA